MNRFRLIAVATSLPLASGVFNARAHGTDPRGLAELRPDAQRRIMDEVVLPRFERALAPRR